MPRMSVTAVTLVTAVAAAGTVTPGAGAAHTTTPGPKIAGTPFVLVVQRSPVTVAGWRFAPGERVVVTLAWAPAPLRAAATVTADGRFIARFPAARIGRCTEARVVVRSRRGTTATSGAAPACRSTD